VNTGISGNRVLRDGADGLVGESAGPSALDRAGDDVLAVPGATAVILLAGINDLGMPPNDDPVDIIDGYERLIARFQGAGLRVLHGTVTPAGGSTVYGTAEVDTRRAEINEWIRTESPADAVVDFDAVVRDPADASRLAPELDGGDRLHLNGAGNEALAGAVPLEQLETCAPPG
jgi:lysophospholipase L1-like esterase